MDEKLQQEADGKSALKKLSAKLSAEGLSQTSITEFLKNRHYGTHAGVQIEADLAYVYRRSFGGRSVGDDEVDEQYRKVVRPLSSRAFW